MIHIIFIWLFLPIVVTLKLIHSIGFIKNPFPFDCLYIPPYGWIQNDLFIYLPVDSHFWCLPFSPDISKPTLNILVGGLCVKIFSFLS